MILRNHYYFLKYSVSGVTVVRKEAFPSVIGTYEDEFNKIVLTDEKRMTSYNCYKYFLKVELWEKMK